MSMQQNEEEETRSGFLVKNLVRGLIWFAIIITAFILMENYIQENFKSHIGEIRANPEILYGMYTLSEIVFGILPPELFMMIWILDDIDVSGFMVNLSILAVISYGAGVLGYYIGKNFFQNSILSKSHPRKISKAIRKEFKKIWWLPRSGGCHNTGSIFSYMHVGGFSKYEHQIFSADMHKPHHPLCCVWLDGVEFPQLV
jgi:hypothetical protein